MEPVGFGRRYLALLLDLIFLEIPGALLGAPLIKMAGEDPTSLLLGWVTGRSPIYQSWFLVAYLGMLAVLWSGYFAGFNCLVGQTPGKKLMGLWVLRRDGKLLSLRAALVRFWAGWTLSILTLGIGYFWAAFDSWHQALHDKLYDTMVVKRTS
ncbi:MAG: RDD family protein [Nitrospinaceae bacterium]